MNISAESSWVTTASTFSLCPSMFISICTKSVMGLFPLIDPSELVHLMGFGSLTHGMVSQLTVSLLIQVWVHPELSMALAVKLFLILRDNFGFTMSSCTPRCHCGTKY
jgi:hypothetical protein